MASDSEREEEEYRKVSLSLEELEELRKKINAEKVARLKTELDSLIDRYGIPPANLNTRKVIWPKGMQPAAGVESTIFRYRGEMDARDLEIIKHDVANFYPKGVKVVPITFENGEKAVAVVGIEAQQANAIDAMIKEKKQLEIRKLELEASRKQDSQRIPKPSVPGVPVANGKMAALQAEIDRAMNPNVKPADKDYTAAPKKLKTQQMANTVG